MWEFELLFTETYKIKDDKRKSSICILWNFQKKDHFLYDFALNDILM